MGAELSRTPITTLPVLWILSSVPAASCAWAAPVAATTHAIATWASTNRIEGLLGDRKSTRLNSSHLVISYAVFCLKKTLVDARLDGDIHSVDAIFQVLAQRAHHRARLLQRVVPEARIGQPPAHIVVIFERLRLEHELAHAPELRPVGLGAEELLLGPVGDVLVGGKLDLAAVVAAVGALRGPNEGLRSPELEARAHAGRGAGKGLAVDAARERIVGVRVDVVDAAFARHLVDYGDVAVGVVDD